MAGAFTPKLVTPEEGKTVKLFGVQFSPSWRLNGQHFGMWYYLTHWTWPVVKELS